MSREAMRQALEALEKGETKLRWAAISALKQALAEHDRLAGIEAIEKDAGIHVSQQAEPEQEPDGISWLKRDSGYFTAPTPQPEQEPVAWMQEMPVSGNEERSVRMTTVKMVADEWDNPIPLYTAPTPRKPVELTDEQIVQVLGSVRESITGSVFLAFARAIIAEYERKNGITGEGA